VRVGDIMSGRPIVVGERSADVRRLMETGHVRHLPVVEEGRLVGVWIATGDGPLVMLAPDRVHQTDAAADAAEALDALIGGAEAVLVWEEGRPAGVLTRSDLRALVRAALDSGLGLRHPRAIVVRVSGPAGCGTTTLLRRTLGLLDRVDAAVVQGNAAAAGEVAALAAGRGLDAPEVDRRAGLRAAIDRLAGAQLILVDDRDEPGESVGDVGEDLRVVVIPATGLRAFPPARLDGVTALVATRADEAGEMDTEHALRALRAGRPGLHTFAVAAGRDDRGLEAWVRWLETCAFQGRG
jgi:CBS domain-containing protein